MSKEEKQEQKKRTCFVIMPISDMEGYNKGHFSKVYNYLIKPAAEQCGFIVDRADDSKNTNFIIIDILSKVFEADLVICDLSGRNPNVLFELGLRQAFDKPVILLKDNITSKVFDIDGLRYTEYDSSLVIDNALKNIKEITENIETTLEKDKDINSLIKLLSIKHSASISNTTSNDNLNNYIINSLDGISRRLSKIENRNTNSDINMTSSNPLQGFHYLINANPDAPIEDLIRRELIAREYEDSKKRQNSQDINIDKQEAIKFLRNNDKL